MSDTGWWWLIGVGLVALLALAVGLAIQEERQWQQYRADHHCRVTGRISASNGWGTGSKGEMVITYIPGKALWLCDGGEIIGRDE